MGKRAGTSHRRRRGCWAGERFDLREYRGPIAIAIDECTVIEVSGAAFQRTVTLIGS